MTDFKKGWSDEETFKFWVPAQALKISKAESTSKDGKKGTTRWIQGIASTGSRDLQGEIVSQNGIDVSYFLKHGYFNNDHKPGFENKVGEPTECKVTKNGLWVKGFLYEDHKIADEIWKLMHSQEATPGSRRRIGFSIEGKVKRRNGNTIDECWIQDIAITPAPVNTTTWAEIAKSLSAQEWNLLKKSETEEEAEKALSVGYSSPVVPESLDSKTKDNVSKSLTFPETVNFIQTQTGLGVEDARNIASLIFVAQLQE